MDFYQSLELLKKATPENIAQQLLALNIAIQGADKQTVVAIYFTLDALSENVDSLSTAWQQIYKLKASVKSRMVFLLSSEQLPGAKKALYDCFTSAVGYFEKLDQAMK